MFDKHCKNNLPSDDVISQCFVSKFLEDESTYKSKIQAVETGESLSFDHTFKQLPILDICMMTGNGCASMTQLFLYSTRTVRQCHGNSLKALGLRMLDNYLKRFLRETKPMQQCTIGTIYVDNCCQWKSKICEVLGSESDVVVYLDIFHVVKRISKKIPKRHPYHSSCLQHF